MGIGTLLPLLGVVRCRLGEASCAESSRLASPYLTLEVAGVCGVLLLG